MRVLLYIQIVLGLLGSLAAWIFASPHAGWSFACGAALTLLNLAILVFAWPMILARKQFALGVVAIVSKFAILSWILYLVAHSSAILLGWFAFGLATVLPSVVLTSMKRPTPNDVEESANENMREV